MATITKATKAEKLAAALAADSANCPNCGESLWTGGGMSAAEFPLHCDGCDKDISAERARLIVPAHADGEEDGGEEGEEDA